MRAAAALLIANSHLEAFYPRTWLAGDGLLGNTLFYFLSGFGVSVAAGSRGRGFLRWYGRRIMRLYPAVILSVLVVQVLLQAQWRTWKPLDYFQAMIFPTTFGYVGHIMLVYALLYWLLKPGRQQVHLAAAVTCAAIAVTCAAFAAVSLPPHAPLMLGQVSPAMHFWFFTTIALLGAYLAPRLAPRSNRGIADGLLVLGLFIVYVLLKFAMVHGIAPRAFFSLYLLAGVLAVVILRVSSSRLWQLAVGWCVPVRWFVSFLAAVTLEMYIVQSFTAGFTPFARQPFPLNLALFWVTTFAGAALLSIAVSPVTPRSRTLSGAPLRAG